jgi:hypothetical protein
MGNTVSARCAAPGVLDRDHMEEMDAVPRGLFQSPDRARGALPSATLSITSPLPRFFTFQGRSRSREDRGAQNHADEGARSPCFPLAGRKKSVTRIR